MEPYVVQKFLHNSHVWVVPETWVMFLEPHEQKAGYGTVGRKWLARNSDRNLASLHQHSSGPSIPKVGFHAQPLYRGQEGLVLFQFNMPDFVYSPLEPLPFGRSGWKVGWGRQRRAGGGVGERAAVGMKMK